MLVVLPFYTGFRKFTVRVCCWSLVSAVPLTRVAVAAIIFTIIAVISVFAYFGYRARIPLATILLQTVMDIAKHHPSVYVVAFVALITQAAVSVWFSFTAIATYERWTPGNPGMC
jgi:hypothetical protein